MSTSRLPAEVRMHPRTLAFVRSKFAKDAVLVADHGSLFVAIQLRGDPSIALGWLHWHAIDGTFLEATPPRSTVRIASN